MPIIPPSLPWIRAAASYVPPKPMPEPLDFVGVIHNTNEGIIEQITDPATLTTLSALRDKIISSSNGDKSMIITSLAVGKQCAPGQPTSRILDILESNLVDGYSLLLGNRGL